ncbi:uncharacterized protein LOC114288303 [Camellia sinensis]|uniref:uncharacterized protein LOC114288303 n=1 Tax=Camellia sinensis TaxID=4442 RepID=UPI001036ABBA|nr:uncharacterized protein LOC114288303 [Camellia sinensis]
MQSDQVSNPLLFFVRNYFTNGSQNSLITRIVSSFNILFNGLPALRVISSQKHPHSDLPEQVITPIKGLRWNMMIMCYCTVEESKFVFEAKIIQRMELLVLSTLQWKMNPVTPLSFVDHIVRRFGFETDLHLEFLWRCIDNC